MHNNLLKKLASPGSKKGRRDEIAYRINVLIGMLHNNKHRSTRSMDHFKKNPKSAAILAPFLFLVVILTTNIGSGISSPSANYNAATIKYHTDNNIQIPDIPSTPCNGSDHHNMHCDMNRKDEIEFCKTLDRYRQQHPKFADKSKKRTLYMLPMWGLANRLRGLSSAITLGEINNINTVIIWADETSNFKARWHDMFAAPEIPQGCWPGDTTRNEAAQCTVHWIANYHEWDDIQDKWEAFGDDGEEVLCVQTYMFLTEGEWRTTWWYQTLVPHPAIQSHVDTFINQKGWFEWGQFVGIHIRRTDNPRSNQVPLSAFTDIVDRLCWIGNATKSELRVYIATDDPASEEEMIGLLKDSGCFPKANAILGYPKPVRDQSGDDAMATAERRTTISGMQEAIADLYLLSRCPFLIGIHGSTFSRAARYWGNTFFVLAGNGFIEKLPSRAKESQKNNT